METKTASARCSGILFSSMHLNLLNPIFHLDRREPLCTKNEKKKQIVPFCLVMWYLLFLEEIFHSWQMFIHCFAKKRAISNRRRKVTDLRRPFNLSLLILQHLLPLTTSIFPSLLFLPFFPTLLLSIFSPLGHAKHRFYSRAGKGEKKRNDASPTNTFPRLSFYFLRPAKAKTTRVLYCRPRHPPKSGSGGNTRKWTSECAC